MRSWCLTYTPSSTFLDQKLITAWCRLHRVDPDRCFLVRLVPWLRLAVIGLYQVDSRGQLFIHDGDLAWSFTLRIVRLPLPFELSAESWKVVPE